MTLDDRVTFQERPHNVVRKLKRLAPHANENYDHAHEDAEGFHDAHVITSQIVNRKLVHMPVLDIDIAHQYYPSTTEGHAHLYIDKVMSWREYKALLKALEAAGIIETGYYRASVGRKYTSVRLPWIKKE